MNILITGLMGSGKSLVAGRIENQFGHTKVSMAKWIKQTVAKHYGLQEIDKALVLNDKPMRTILQEVGMFMRKVDPNWHIDEAIEEIKSKNIKNFVIDDIRFLNEVDKLTKLFDCKIIKIKCTKYNRLERILVRDLVVPTETQLSDSSEVEVNKLPFDYLIENDGNKDALFEKVDAIIRSIKC